MVVRVIFPPKDSHPAAIAACIEVMVIADMAANPAQLEREAFLEAREIADKVALG